MRRRCGATAKRSLFFAKSASGRGNCPPSATSRARKSDKEDYAAAEANLHQAVALTGTAGHFALSMIYCYMAESHWGQGKIDDALEHARTALALGQKTENQDYIGNAWRTLGLVAARLPAPVDIDGQAYAAHDCFAESLRVYTGMGAEAERARTLRDWARYEHERGHREASATMWRESLEIFTRLGMERELERMAQRSDSSE